MSTWRKKAIELLPEFKNEFNKKDLSIYDVFIELLPATITAHKEHNKEVLRKYYDFARWCIDQKDKELWNAAGVAFYEHLVDQEETFKDIHIWVGRQVYNKIKALLERRLSPEKFQILDKQYR